jgi:hypothetical protein
VFFHTGTAPPFFASRLRLTLFFDEKRKYDVEIIYYEYIAESSLAMHNSQFMSLLFK